MANRRPQTGGRRMDFGRNDRMKNFNNRGGVSPWQGGGPSAGLTSLLPLGGGGSTEATLALANNLINNLLQSRQNTVPSLLDMPMRRDFNPDMGHFDRGYVPNRMGNQGNFRRTGNYNRAGERINTNRKQFRPNDGPRHKQSSPKKEADKAKPVVNKESDVEVKEETEAGETEKEVKSKEEEKKEAAKTRYDDIVQQLLKCHICNKSMWDGRSFENHLSGRAHAIMMQKTAESYALTADTMRQEFKIRDMKRTRKTGQQQARDFYCAMCDMYAADGAIHRTTVGHRKLKKYLHPNCTSCHKEMPTRIELDEHRLTAEHLRNVQDKQETVSKPKPEVMVLSTLSMEQLYVRDDRRKRRHTNAESAQDKEENEVNEDVEMKKEDDGEVKKESQDNDDTITDYQEGDDLSNFTKAMLPAYSTVRGVGASFLAPFSCVQCKLCNKLLETEETAEVHLRTWRHHQLFVKMLRDKSGTEGGDGNKRSNEEQTDSGECKRRKTEADGANGDVADDVEGGNVDEDGDVDMNTSNQDWEQTVDEILQDEQVNEPEEDAETVAEPEVEEEPVVEEPPKPVPPPAAKPVYRGTPRGRGRRGGRR